MKHTRTMSVLATRAAEGMEFAVAPKVADSELDEAADKAATLEIIIDLPLGFPINNIISLRRQLWW